MSELRESAAESLRSEMVNDATVVATTARHPQVDRAVRYLLDRWEMSSDQPLPKTIAVVSAISGEGVTTVAHSLAELLSIETSDGVCWIDLSRSSLLDMRETRAASHELLDITPIRQEVDTKNMAPVNSEDPTIRLLAEKGTSVEYRPTLPGRPALFDLLGTLANECGHIVLDTPPMLSESDCLGLIRQADAYVLVTRQGSTTMNQVRTLTDELRTIPLLGAVLNDYRTRTPRFIRRLLWE